LAALEIGNVATEARPLVAADKKNFGGEVTKGVIAVVVNAILARAAAQDDAESSKKGKGGGGKKGESKSKKPTVRIRAPAPPPADAKKALLQKENMAALQAAMKDEAAQFACCQALEAWLASEQGAAGAMKVLEPLYDADILEEGPLLKFWVDVQATVERQSKEIVALTQSVEAHNKFVDEKNEELKKAEHEEQESAWWNKQAAAEAQYARCGQNAPPDEQAREKAANHALRKAVELDTNRKKILAASKKKAVEAQADLSSAQKELQTRTEQAVPMAAVQKNGEKFFTWLQEAEEDSD